jgi:hypothetical protein
MTRWNCLAPDAATQVATPPDRGGGDADQVPGPSLAIISLINVCLST